MAVIYPIAKTTAPKTSVVVFGIIVIGCYSSFLYIST